MSRKLLPVVENSEMALANGTFLYSITSENDFGRNRIDNQIFFKVCHERYYGT